MKGLAYRRYLNEKVSEKRWRRYHDYNSVWYPRNDYFKFILAKIGMSTRFPPVGWYKKRKGCECRSCSNVKKQQKRSEVLKLRTEVRIENQRLKKMI